MNDILALTSSVPHLDEGEVFRYSEQKKIAKKVSDRLRNLHSAVYAAIKNDIALEWDEANTACDELAASCFGKEILSDKRFAGWFERNTEAMEAFISRSEAGLNLSDRIWQPVKQLRSEMELAMTVAIGDGDSASQISRYVRQYLNNPDKLFRRIRDEKGNLKLSKAAKAYHPGQGVYRSSAKNAMRIARTETNIAYRRADNTRWQQMDFVIGQEINLSRNHPVTDICDTLAGRYPKNFVFDGWHPQCFCYVVPILLSEKDMMAMQQAKLNGEDYDISGKVIADMPGNFKSWAIDNAERIEKAKTWYAALFHQEQQEDRRQDYQSPYGFGNSQRTPCGKNARTDTGHQAALDFTQRRDPARQQDTRTGSGHTQGMERAQGYTQVRPEHSVLHGRYLGR